MNNSSLSNTGTGTVCGTLLSILPNIHLDDLLQTVILAAIGAVVSFFVTVLCKRFLKRNK